jgi:hypothetical protein
MPNSRSLFSILPFVQRKVNPTGQGYDFWCPEDVIGTEAREHGRRYCLAYLMVEAENLRKGRGAILGLILDDMIMKQDTGQVAMGFLYTLAETLAYCAMDPAFMDEIRFRQGE